MKRALAISTFVAGVIAFVGGSVPGGVASADQQSAAGAAQVVPEWYSVSVVKVKPEMVTEYVELQKSEVIPALQRGGVRERQVWQPAVFGTAFEYHIVTPIASLARYDGQSPMVQALGEEGARALSAKSRRMIESSQTFLIRLRTDMSNLVNAAPRLATVSFVTTASGRAGDFANVIKSDVLPAVKKNQIQYHAYQTVFGGDPNTFILVSPVENFAALSGTPPIVKALGGDEAYGKVIAKTAGIVTKVERHIMRRNAELSFSVGTSTSVR